MEDPDGISSKVLLGVLELSEAKRLRSVLQSRGVHLQLINNPQTCSTGGCKPMVEVHAEELDVPIVREILKAEDERSMAGLEYDTTLSQEVYDPEKPSARCPACGTQFSTSNKECPDCGLVFFAE